MKKVSTKSNFLFKTKADTLKQLVKLVEQSKIEKIYVFTVEEWQSSQTTILKRKHISKFMFHSSPNHHLFFLIKKPNHFLKYLADCCLNVFCL